MENTCETRKTCVGRGERVRDVENACGTWRTRAGHIQHMQDAYNTCNIISMCFYKKGSSPHTPFNMHGAHLLQGGHPSSAKFVLCRLVRLSFPKKEGSINPSIRARSWHTQLNEGSKLSVHCSVLICLSPELAGSTAFCVFYTLVFFFFFFQILL